MLLRFRQPNKGHSILETKLIPRRNGISDFNGKNAAFVGKFIIPLLYMVSFFLVYQYYHTSASLHRNTDLQIIDSVESYIYNYGLEPVPAKDQTINYEQFQYGADAVMLPNAPYKHVTETTDLRTTQLIYLDAVRHYLKKTRLSGKNKPPQLGFHWKDWIEMQDLDPLIREKPNCFIAGVLGSNVRTPWPGCIDKNSKDPEDMNFYFENPAMVHESEYRLALRAKTYLYQAAPIPNKMVFLTGELAFVVKVGQRQDMIKSGLLDQYLQARLEDSTSKGGAVQEEDLLRQPLSGAAILDEIATELKRELVDLDGTLVDYSYLPMTDFELPPKKKKAKKALNAAAAKDRHFSTVLVDHDGQKFEASYDWRFFKSTLEFTEHRAALHHTIRAFLAMTNNLGIVAWLSQESLIGWARNGIILPWETVVHFEMSAKEMARVASTFNHSLIITDPSESSNTYFIDMSPHFMERARKNDGNASPEAPDARFIDTKTGVYIELNGLMSGDGRVPDHLKSQYPDETSRFNFVNSGMGKFYHISDLMPLKRTLFEGKIANVPGDAIKIVTEDYNDVVSADSFFNYRYHEHLRLWVPKDKCSYVPQEDINIFEKGGSTYIGACHDEKIWREYNMTQHATSFRYKEIRSTTQLKLGARDELPVLYPDIWLDDRVETLKKKYGYP